MVKRINLPGVRTLATWTALSKQTTLVIVADLTQTKKRVPRTPTTAVGVLISKSFFLNFNRSLANTLTFPRSILNDAVRFFSLESNSN